MGTFGIVLIVLAGLAVLFFLVTMVCFFMAFYASRKEPKNKEEFEIPPGRIYEPHRETMVQWMKEGRSLPQKDVSITSFEGLKLCGKYYEYTPGAPVELMFHGYRGTAERDLCGGIQRCFALRRSVLLVDQRCSGKSDGHVITFGIKECRDCLSWIDFLIKEHGEGVKIILTGISMGAATVMMAAGRDLPKEVIGILADCGYTSPKAIIKKVIRQMGLPAELLYPFVRCAARLYGGFSLEEDSPIEAMARCKVPAIFVHGESDNFVPCDMSRQCYEACTAPKLLLTVPGAGHGLSYVLDGERNLTSVREFEKNMGLPGGEETGVK